MILSGSRILALLTICMFFATGLTIAQQNAPPPQPQQPGMSAPGMTPPPQNKKKHHHCNKQYGPCPKKHKQQGQPNSMMPQQAMPQPAPTHL